VQARTKVLPHDGYAALSRVHTYTHIHINKNLIQVRTHAQKYFLKMARQHKTRLEKCDSDVSSSMCDVKDLAALSAAETGMYVCGYLFVRMHMTRLDVSSSMCDVKMLTT
jgi:hypothetical protein